MTYLELQTQFLALLNRRDCTTDMAKAFIQSAMFRLRDDLRQPGFEATTTVTVTAPWGGVPIPADFMELINLIPLTTQGGLTATDYKRLEKCDISTALVGAIGTGLPRQYARAAAIAKWIVAPAPVVGDTIQVDYYAQPALLVNDSDTNNISVTAPDLVYYCALVYAGVYFVDVRKDGWEMTYQQILDRRQWRADRDEQQGASVVMPYFHIPDDLGSDGSNIVQLGY